MNITVLTDGEASRSVGVRGAKRNAAYAKQDSGWERYPSTVLRWGGKQYAFTDTAARYGRQCETETIVRYLRDRTGARVYGFFLMAEKTAARYIKGSNLAWKTPVQQAAAVAQLDTDGSAVVPHPAYDEYYIVGIAGRTESEDFMDRLDANGYQPAQDRVQFRQGYAGSLDLAYHHGALRGLLRYGQAVAAQHEVNHPQEPHPYEALTHFTLGFHVRAARQLRSVPMRSP